MVLGCNGKNFPQETCTNKKFGLSGSPDLECFGMLQKGEGEKQNQWLVRHGTDDFSETKYGRQALARKFLSAML